MTSIQEALDNIELDDQQITTAKDLLTFEKFADEIKYVIELIGRAAHELGYHSLMINDLIRQGDYKEANRLKAKIMPLLKEANMKVTVFPWKVQSIDMSEDV